MATPIYVGQGISIESGVKFGRYPLPPSNGIVAYYNAGDNASYSGTGTTWFDLSGQGNDVTMVNSGSISWTSAGAASYFTTGTTGYFTGPGINNIPTGNANYTFAAWINGPGQGTWGSNGIVSIGGFETPNQSNALRVDGANQLNNYWWANDLVAGTTAPATGWFYVVATFDGTTRAIYVNGVLEGSDTPTGHNVTSSTINVANTWAASAEALNGDIGQLWIYNFGLTGPDILANFNATKGTYGL